MLLELVKYHMPEGQNGNTKEFERIRKYDDVLKSMGKVS